MSVASSHSHSGTDASVGHSVVAHVTHVIGGVGGVGGGIVVGGLRQRLGSVGDSVPASDSSEGTASESYEHSGGAHSHWSSLHQMEDQQHRHSHQLHQLHHNNNIGQNNNQRQSALLQQQQHQQHRQSYSLSSHVSDRIDDDDDAGQHFVVGAASSSAASATSVGHHDEDDEDLGGAGGSGSGNGGGEVAMDSLSLEQGGVLSDLERGQVESFFSGLGTEIFVCPSLANLYENCGQNDWRLVYTGVPVLLHDKGSTRSRSTPRVTLVLAERGTCFALWQDTVDQMSEYKIGGPAFHTMCMSSDHSKLVGFSYDSSQAADETWHTVEKLIADPANQALNTSGGRKRAAKQPKRPKPAPLPPKEHISAPCQFQHVTSVTTHDAPRYFSLQAFVNATAKHRSH